MATARRPLLTATAAGTLLAVLWFVPSANATDESTGTPGAQSRQVTAVADTTTGPRLADTGTGVDTTPYLIGGTAFLGIGAAFVTYSVRRADPLSV
ncbi:hypothetical protein [Streptomyces sp. Ncost-T10-10d]|uniref:hypothetical protein n=1 Tax=Streptomyces sp. Ncost-T10-10d TaxID=1839774 RepID=UPI00081F16C9|nr:hypothetical protein [Streptomyces sp. Ncost-T10-10d]SCF96166.1 hypothetical protein GA0115254_128026 [Streptomyces sp. Ncost-T10-10d]